MTGTKMIYSYFSPEGGSWILESSVDFEHFMQRRYSQRLYRYLFEEYFHQIEREHNNLRHFDLIHQTALSSRSLLTGDVVPITAEVREALGEQGEVRRRDEAILVYRRYDMEELQYDFVKEAIVRFEYDLSYYHSFMRRLYLISIGAALGLILLLTLLAYVLVERTFVRRFARLREVIAAAAEGNYRPRVEFTSRIGEMQNLAAATNKLIETVSAREADLRASLDERESLLNEIHHRVKNNLNVVVSLLNLQAQQFSTLEEAQRAFSNTYNRIYTMALTHEMLYQSDNLSEIPMREYLETFLARFQQDGGGAAQHIRTRARVENVALDIGYAVPCGIIINELLTNAFTHAFPEGRTGTVEIELRHISARQFRLSVADDGIGFPGGRVPDDSDTGGNLGLALVRTLAAQLAGSLEFRGEGGVRCTLVFATSGAEAPEAPPEPPPIEGNT
jgi:two-component sensor histidine kinase